METIVAKSAGFCYGVARAVNGIYSLPKTGNMVCLGPITHNSAVLERLKHIGIDIIDSPAQSMSRTVIIRAHGEARSIYDFMEANNIEYIDFTCPDVKKIHKIVSEKSGEGYEIIIIGDSHHPEIIGCIGWCENKDSAPPSVISSPEECEHLVLYDDKKYAVVVQTTFQASVFDEIAAILKSKSQNIEFFNTICQATAKRQDEADEISKNVDKMIVLGDKSSSNTRKLYEICKKNCKNTYFVESIDDLVLNNFSKNDRIGITAGASTPPDIIEEAITRMSEQDNKTNNQSFEEMLDESFVSLHTGDIVKGTVIQIAGGEVSVNLGYKSDGLIPRGEFSDNPDLNPEDVLKPGDEIEVFVVRVNDREGDVLLSKKRLEMQKGYTEIEEAYENKTTVKGRVAEVIKGGLSVMVKGVRVFVPSSQISSRFVEDLNQFKGKEFDFEILELDKGKRRIVGGRKELIKKEEAEIKERVFSTLEEGQQVEGTVSRIAAFGAFVDIGGIDGLIHISELSWGRIRRVSDVLKEGDKVVAVVLKLDKEKDKISLSLKGIRGNPWENIEQKYPPGAIVDGTVVRMVPFGAFIELEPGVDGLVHISQISHKHIAKAQDELEIGQLISVKIVDVDVENSRISLSKKEADEILYPRSAEEAAEVAVEEVAEAVEEVVEAVEEVVEDVAEAVEEAAEEVAEAAEEVVEEVAEAAEEIAEDMVEAVEETAEDNGE